MKYKINVPISKIIIISSLIIITIIGAIIGHNKDSNSKEIKDEENVMNTTISTSITSISSILSEEKKSTTKKEILISKVDNVVKEKVTTVSTTDTITTSTTREEEVLPELPYSRLNYVPTDQEIFMLCVVVSQETGYCEAKAQKAVCNTVINRVNSDKFPNNLYDVLTQRNQYTAVNAYFTGNYRKYLEPGSDLWNNTVNIVLECLNEADFTNGATAYYNPEINGYNQWFEQYQLVYQDKYGRFFKV